MRQETSLLKSFDWLTVGIYLSLLLIGWLNIHAAIYTPHDPVPLFDMGNQATKQLLWIVVALLIAAFLVLIDFKIYFSIPYILYGAAIVALLGVFVLGVKVNGAKAWYQFGGFRIMPAEFCKVAVAIALAKLFDSRNVQFGFNQDTVLAFLIIIIPSLIIIKQNETGSVLVLLSMIIMMYRQGLHFLIPLSGILLAIIFIVTLALITYEIDLWYLIIPIITLAVLTAAWFLIRKKKGKWIYVIVSLFLGVIFSGIVFSTGTLFQKLPKHQQKRLESLIDPEKDKLGAGYQTIRSKMAISSGGWTGKGYLHGELTQGDFIPEQHTDFIFTTIAEEHGFWGTGLVVILYLALISRLIIISERQKSVFARVFGYCVISILLFHFIVNVGMTMGYAPVVGIPLPFLSYGGSSLWAFTMLVFILLKLDMHRSQILARG